jgi:hypothetical protein
VNLSQSMFVGIGIDDRFGEGFRMPSGVGKPPKHEPAGLR